MTADPNPAIDIVSAIHGGVELSICVPDNISNKDLFDGIKKLSVSVAKTERRARAERYFLGHMMAKAANRPDFLQTAGFDKFSDFEDALVKMSGLERTTLWNWKPIAKELPELSRDHLAKIGQQSLSLIARHVPESKRPAMLEAATQMTYQKFKAHAEEQGLVGAGEVGGASIILSGSKAKIKDIKTFLDDPAVQAKVESSDYCEIILSMVQEVFIEWTQKP